MTLVVEYQVPKRRHRSQRGSPVQRVSIWESTHVGPCRSVSPEKVNCDWPHPGG
jgi:hypothetical protein